MILFGDLIGELLVLIIIDVKVVWYFYIYSINLYSVDDFSFDIVMWLFFRFFFFG